MLVCVAWPVGNASGTVYVSASFSASCQHPTYTPPPPSALSTRQKQCRVSPQILRVIALMAEIRQQRPARDRATASRYPHHTKSISQRPMQASNSCAASFISGSPAHAPPNSAPASTIITLGHTGTITKYLTPLSKPSASPPLPQPRAQRSCAGWPSLPWATSYAPCARKRTAPRP